MYVRVSLMVAKQGCATEVSALLDEITRFCADQPGCLHSYRLDTNEPTGLTGRVTVWRSEGEADAVARSARMLSLRSELDSVALSGREVGLSARDMSRDGALSPISAIRDAERLLGFSGPTPDEYNIP